MASAIHFVCIKCLHRINIQVERQDIDWAEHCNVSDSKDSGGAATTTTTTESTVIIYDANAKSNEHNIKLIGRAENEKRTKKIKINKKKNERLRQQT